MTIKQDDIVRCIDVSGYDMSHLTLDGIYTVEWTDGTNIKLVGVEYSTKVWRFGVVNGVKQ
jgi:hypothetical protein